MEITLKHTDLIAVVDDADAELVTMHKWYLSSDGYVKGSVHGVHVKLHRHLVACPSGTTIHHIDGDRLNNKRSNLRIMTNSRHMTLHKNQELKKLTDWAEKQGIKNFGEMCLPKLAAIKRKIEISAKSRLEHI